MTSSSLRRPLRAVLAAVLALLLGCATTPPAPPAGPSIAVEGDETRALASCAAAFQASSKRAAAENDPASEKQVDQAVWFMTRALDEATEAQLEPIYKAQYGSYLLRPRASAAEQARVAAVLEQDLQACERLRARVMRDGARAARISCNRGDGKACADLAQATREGASGILKDAVRAVALFEKACAAGHGQGCVRAGFILTTGEGVPADPARAAPLFLRGCELGNGSGCYNAGRLFRRGEGVAKDPARGAALLQKGCGLGDPNACKMTGAAPPAR